MNKSNKPKKEPRKSSKKKTDHDKIIKYLNSIQKILKEKNLLTFYSFPDSKTFTKIKKSRSEVQKMLKENDKYQNRQLAEIVIMFHHDGKEDNLLDKHGIYLTATIRIWNVDKEGNMNNKKNPGWRLTIHWEKSDFAISRLSMKLIHQLMKLTADKTIKSAGFYGLPLTKVIDRLKREKINITGLEPLI